MNKFNYLSIIKNPLTIAHHLAASALSDGDSAVDATAGNGYDTLFLCRAVGPTGVVYAFDNQPLAIGRTAERIREKQIETRVYLINSGHEKMNDYITSPVRVVMFNLGYLPGTGRSYSTRPDTTVEALGKASRLLEAGGLITVVVYTGHEGALDEQAAVESWAASLPQDEWTVVRFDYPNWRNSPPYLLAMTRIGRVD